MLLPEAAGAAPRTVAVTWDQLEPMILGERVTIQLPNNVSIDGRVIEVKPDSLTVDILRSSNRAVQPVGSAELPRASLTTIRLHHHRRYVRPLLLILDIGALIAVSKYNRSVATAIAIGFGIGFGSPILARKLSDGVTVITIQK